MNYIVIDIEASSLGQNSYPIEFAWGSPSRVIQSFLINPTRISSWTDWSVSSQNIHNISYSDLLKEGVTPRKAWNTIVQLFACHHVYSDKPSYDASWLHAFSALNTDTSLIQINDTRDLIRRNLDNRGENKTDVEQIYKRAAQVCPPTHRAATDVAYLLKAIELSLCGYDGDD